MAGMTKAGMKEKIILALNALGIVGVDFTEKADDTLGGATMEQILEAFCEGIIGEITANAVVTQANDSGGDAEQPGSIA